MPVTLIVRVIQWAFPVMTTVGTAVDSPTVAEKETSLKDIVGFKRLVKSASRTAETLSPNDLPAAFQLSFSLMERISDLMLEAFAFLNSGSSERADNFVFDGFGRRSPTSALSPIHVSKETSSSSADLISPILTDYKESDGSEKRIDGLTRTYEEAEMNASEHSEIPNQSDLEREQNVMSPSVEDSLRIDLPTEDFRAPASESDDLLPSSIHALQQSASPTKRVRVDPCTVQPFSKKFARSNGPFPSQLLNGRLGESTTRDWSLGSRMSSDVRRWRLSSTDRLNSLIDECERQVNGRKLYVCKFCGKVYEIKSSMRYHMKIIHLQMHLKTTEMQCRICGKQFTCVSAVNRHQAKCILSTYPDPGCHRVKNCLALTTTTVTDPISPRHISSLYAESNFGSGVSDVDNMPNFSAGTNQADSHSMNALFVKNQFHQVSSASTPIKGLQDGVFFAESTRSGYPVSTSYDSSERSGSQLTQESAFSPPRAFKQDPLRSGVDSFRNSIANYWNGIPQFSGNISEMTPLQLEMCMKAFVQGFHPNAASFTGNVNSQCPFTDMKSELLVTPRQSNPSRPSFSSIRTPSDTSELEPSQSLENDEVAIDLSARPCLDSVMIESF
ncbi:hypothetical protein CRM22_007164 [Opisthorchis felineus]|uniref:C2H2-type domain-containing protein n=1 Tax=Opisthorchis felineus TaxID=147828 RepID=A0A4S2LH89_OPIFE|nr:hypothetical protein CRM22_007164 [Opisthorchis felineus]